MYITDLSWKKCTCICMHICNYNQSMICNNNQSIHHGIFIVVSKLLLPGIVLSSVSRSSNFPPKVVIFLTNNVRESLIGMSDRNSQKPQNEVIFQQESGIPDKVGPQTDTNAVDMETWKEYLKMSWGGYSYGCRRNQDPYQDKSIPIATTIPGITGVWDTSSTENFWLHVHSHKDPLGNILF